MEKIFTLHSIESSDKTFILDYRSFNIFNNYETIFKTKDERGHFSTGYSTKINLISYDKHLQYCFTIDCHVGYFYEDKHHLNPNCLFYTDSPRYKEIVKQIFNGICELTRKDIITPFLNDR